MGLDRRNRDRDHVDDEVNEENGEGYTREYPYIMGQQSGERYEGCVHRQYRALHLTAALYAIALLLFDYGGAFGSIAFGVYRSGCKYWIIECTGLGLRV